MNEEVMSAIAELGMILQKHGVSHLLVAVEDGEEFTSAMHVEGEEVLETLFGGVDCSVERIGEAFGLDEEGLE